MSDHESVYEIQTVDYYFFLQQINFVGGKKMIEKSRGQDDSVDLLAKAMG